MRFGDPLKFAPVSRRSGIGATLSLVVKIIKSPNHPRNASHQRDRRVSPRVKFLTIPKAKVFPICADQVFEEDFKVDQIPPVKAFARRWARLIFGDFAFVLGLSSFEGALHGPLPAKEVCDVE